MIVVRTVDNIFAIYNGWIKYDEYTTFYVQNVILMNLRDYVGRWSDRSIDWNKQWTMNNNFEFVDESTCETNSYSA